VELREVQEEDKAQVEVALSFLMERGRSLAAWGPPVVRGPVDREAEWDPVGVEAAWDHPVQVGVVWDPVDRAAEWDPVEVEAAWDHPVQVGVVWDPVDRAAADGSVAL
jgi:hypothetical protein